jgi:CcmD family protein
MNLNYLFAAYSLIWSALFVFMLRLASKLNKIQHDLDLLQERKN